MRKIPHLDVIEKYTLKPFRIIEPTECWFELSYYEVGEFEVRAVANARNEFALQKGNYIKIPNKRFIWVITSVKKGFTAKGARVIIAKGYEAKWLLKKGSIDMPLQLPSTLTNAVVKLLDTFLRPQISYLGYELINIDITLSDTQAPRGNLLEFVNNMLKNYNCGSQVVYDHGELKYKVLQGNDKTRKIKFTQSLDNLLSLEYLTDDTDLATRVVVVCKIDDVEYTEVYDTGATGVDRATITLNSNLSTTYLDSNGSEKKLDLTNVNDLALFKKWLREEGKTELKNHTVKEEVNAEIDITNSMYEFNNDYYLGDRVGVKDEYFNLELTPRILKYTFSQDAKGLYTEAVDYGE